jgi:hypothetical protein
VQLLPVAAVIGLELLVEARDLALGFGDLGLELGEPAPLAFELALARAPGLALLD